MLAFDGVVYDTDCGCVDQREKVGLPGSVSAYGYRSAGAGATIYIGDTGIYPHSDLAGRISTSGYSSINDENGTVDCNGHGTHVAATAAGTKYGLAKNARVVPVRLLNCAGSGFAMCTRYTNVVTALGERLKHFAPLTHGNTRC